MCHIEVRFLYNKLHPFSKEKNYFSFNSIINDTVIIGTITIGVALNWIPWKLFTLDIYFS